MSERGEYKCGNTALMMDEKPKQGGLHVFMVRRTGKLDEFGDEVRETLSVHLSRKQAIELAREIIRRA